MLWTQRLWLKLQTLFGRKHASGRLDDEIQFHLEQQIAENIAAGMNPNEARYAARRAFGNRTEIKEITRETWGWTSLEQFVQDVRFALRQLWKTPGFTMTGVLTLALGIGANAAIFTLVHAVLLQSLPVADPKTLVRIGENSDCCVNSGLARDVNYSMFSTDIYERMKQNLPEFEELAAIQAGFAWRPIIERRDGTQESARSVMGEFVSGNYFRTFGLRPEAGRLIADADDVKGAPMVALMSDRFWRSNYSADPSVIGSTFWVNTQAVTIAGITPPGFYGDRLSTNPPDFYLPTQALPILASAPYVNNKNSSWLYMIGRVKPGVQLPALQAKVNTILQQALGETDVFSVEKNKKLLAKAHTVLAPGGAGIQDMRQEYESNLRLLLIASALVLLIACANIANLLLVRGMKRKVELSVRTALGAARGRIIRQLLTESVALAGLGGLAGLAFAYGGTQMLLSLAFPDAQNMPVQATPSAPVLAFACGLSLLTGILFGIAPAWIAARTYPADALRSGTRGTSEGASPLQRRLVSLQAALSLVLLVGAGLFGQSLQNLQGTDLKLDAHNRYIIHINPQAAGYAPSQLEPLYRSIVQRFHTLPAVRNVGLSTYTPMESNNWSDDVQVQGLPDTNTSASFVRVSPEYFDSVGTRVVMGRGIGLQDAPGAPVVAVVNRAFVKHYLPNVQNPIGRHFGSPGPQSPGDFEIVGVVEDTVYSSVRWDNHYMYFLPTLQRAPSDKSPIERDVSLYAGTMVVETQWPLNNMEELAAKTLSEINPNLAVVKFQTFEDQIADRFSEDRLLARLTALFGGLSLLLATIGLYGVTAYTVARRTPEIGIRMALGAQRGQVTTMVLRGAMSQTLLGLAIGVPAALLSVRYIKTQLYDVKGVNFVVLGLAVLLLGAASALAGWIPARRAASMDPARTLRME